MARRMTPRRWPDRFYEKRTEPEVIDGVWHAANACARCEKWLPPYMAGIPTNLAGLYCWGHDKLKGRCVDSGGGYVKVFVDRDAEAYPPEGAEVEVRWGKAP